MPRVNLRPNTRSRSRRLLPSTGPESSDTRTTESVQDDQQEEGSESDAEEVDSSLRKGKESVKVGMGNHHLRTGNAWFDGQGLMDYADAGELADEGLSLKLLQYPQMQEMRFILGQGVSSRISFILIDSILVQRKPAGRPFTRLQRNSPPAGVPGRTTVSGRSI